MLPTTSAIHAASPRPRDEAVSEATCVTCSCAMVSAAFSGRSGRSRGGLPGRQAVPGGEVPSEVMRAAKRFHRDNAWRQPPNEVSQRAPPHPSTHDNHSRLVQPDEAA